MANTTIESIANNINLGENKVETLLASSATIKPGMGVYKDVGSGAIEIEGSSAISNFKGVAGVNYHMTGMEYAHTQHEGMPVYTEGLVALRVDNPGGAKLAGAELHASGAVKGSFGWSSDEFISLSGYQTVAKIIQDVANGDTVAKARLI